MKFINPWRHRQFSGDYTSKMAVVAYFDSFYFDNKECFGLYAFKMYIIRNKISEHLATTWHS